MIGTVGRDRDASGPNRFGGERRVPSRTLARRVIDHTHACAARVLASGGCVIEHERSPELARAYEAGNRQWRAADERELFGTRFPAAQRHPWNCGAITRT